MGSSLLSIQTLVNKIKQDTFSSTFDPNSFVSPSAYETAWLAMIPHPKQNSCPKFESCLEWIFNNQKEEGYWGETDNDGLPTIDTLPATLVCMVALNTWRVSEKQINKGLAFIHTNSRKLLQEKCEHPPRWFAIVFPAMVELAQATGLKILFPKDLEEVVINISLQRQQILQSEALVDNCHYPPLLSYLEALPPCYVICHENIAMNLSENGSLFQSPSATARAFLATGNQKCMNYLESLVERCAGGVPAMYPIDGELISLCLVNQIQRLGLAEHFVEEIEEILELIYRNYKNQELKEMNDNLMPTKIYKDSLAFRLLRMHGYNVTPRSFCWFLYHEENLVHIKKNFAYFTSALHNVYRATDLMFPGEYELEEARLFSRKLLEKSVTLKSLHDNLVIFPNFQRVIHHELILPWIARLDHLDHRMWIEENKVDTLWIGKASFYRLSCLHNDKLMTLAVENYKFRQSIYSNELEELKRWSKDWGLTDIGFGREKTTYCYFSIASSTSLPHNSIVRKIVAKSGILLTIADDFFDTEGSLVELQRLTQAVQSWDGKSLSGHGKIIFGALENLLSDIAKKDLHQEGSHIMENIRNMWSEALVSWLVEATWSNTGYEPSLDEYLQMGMTSVGSQLLTLPAMCFLSPNTHPICKSKPNNYEIITKLLMVSTRLLNDTQTYERELEDGKTNFVMLHSKGSPQEGIENSVAYAREILDQIEKEFLQHALMDGYNDFPKPCKHLHLSILRCFHMFYNSSNLFDSGTGLFHDIEKAFYVPIEY